MRLSLSSFVRPSRCISSAPTGRISSNYDNWDYFMKICQNKLHILLNSDKNIETVQENPSRFSLSLFFYRDIN